MANVKTAYGSSGALTITLNSLGSGNSRESTAVDNTSDLFLDALVRVTVVAGTVSGDKACYVYAYGSEDGSTYPGTVTGSDAAITLNDPTVLTLVGVIPTPTSSGTYKSNPISIARAFGGVLPRKWGLVLVNATGAALSGSGNSASYSGVYATVI